MNTRLSIGIFYCVCKVQVQDVNKSVYNSSSAWKIQTIKEIICIIINIKCDLTRKILTAHSGLFSSFYVAEVNVEKFTENGPDMIEKGSKIALKV